jgi:hypothetical protein
MSSLIDISWSQLGWDIDGEASGDQTGRSVCLSADGTILAIGAIGNDGNGSNSGHVRVYKYDATKNYVDTCQNSIDFGPVGWRRLGKDIDGEASNDYSGWSVSLSADGTVVAIGATSNDGNGSNSGQVRVYKYDVTKTTAVTDQTSVNFGPVGWRRLGKDIDGEVSNDQAGRSVSLSADGTILAIGGIYNDGNGSNSGHVRVYKYDATKTTAVTDQTSVDFGPVGWRRLGQDIDGETSDDISSYSVSLSADGTVVAIGAPSNGGNGRSSGHMRVYKYDATKNYVDTCQNSVNFGPVGWRRLGQDIDGEAINDESGRAISLSADGTIVAIGAIYNDGNGTDSGHIRVYKYDVTKNYLDTCQNSVNFGPVGWRRLGQDIDGEASSDLSGWTVSLSADGTILAIGSPYNDGNGTDSGHVRVYKYDVTKNYVDTCQNSVNFGPVSWRRLGQDIDGEASNDQSGYLVSLSADGTIVAIGANLNDGNGTDSGHVRVYKLNEYLPISNVCFPAGTPVNTDQGIISIEKINSDKNTIRGNKIETITKTVTQDKYLVCIEKDVLAKNIPSEKTLMSKNHALLYNGKMVKSKELLQLNNEGIHKVKYNGEILYNVLLENKHDKMIVNNLICETLYPKNSIAELYLSMKQNNFTDKQKQNIINNYNKYVIKNKTFTSKK